MQRGLPALPDETLRDIQSRAREQIAAFESAYSRLATTPFLDDWPDPEIDQLAAHFAELPCPALAADGSCRVYPFRPLACRTMGIPIEVDNLIRGACEVQTSVPLIRPSRVTREDEQQLAGQEAVDIAARCLASQGSGEELLLAYGFLADRTGM